MSDADELRSLYGRGATPPQGQVTQPTSTEVRALIQWPIALAYWFFCTGCLFVALVAGGVGLWATLKFVVWCIIHIGTAVGIA